jgi:holliday junction DNA helicase RuvA
MFDQLTGNVVAHREKSIALSVGGVGFSVNVPHVKDFVLSSTHTLFTYFHWNADHGPSLYGFTSELDRSVFLLIIDCPKIGPSIALNIMSQISAGQFLELVTSANEKGLSSLNGIGAKKAEQIILELKTKVQKLLNAGTLKIEQQSNFVQWQQLAEVLASLNYSKPEIATVTSYLAEKHTGQNFPLDALIRSALAYLSQKQM